MNCARQWMTDILNLGYAARGVPIFFKGQNRQQQIHVSLNGARAMSDKEVIMEDIGAVARPSERACRQNKTPSLTVGLLPRFAAELCHRLK